MQFQWTAVIPSMYEKSPTTEDLSSQRPIRIAYLPASGRKYLEASSPNQSAPPWSYATIGDRRVKLGSHFSIPSKPKSLSRKSSAQLDIDLPPALFSPGPFSWRRMQAVHLKPRRTSCYGYFLRMQIMQRTAKNTRTVLLWATDTWLRRPTSDAPIPQAPLHTHSHTHSHTYTHTEKRKNE